MRDRMNKRRYLKILLILLAVVTVVNAFRIDIKVVRYELKSHKISRGFRIVLITDLHSCDYGEQQDKLMNRIVEQKPDIVLLGGDIVDDVLPQAKAKEFLSAVSERFPCYYVSGNHEYWSGDIQNIKEMIEGYGITVLEGETLSVVVNGQSIMLSGVDDPEVGEAAFQAQLDACAEYAGKNDFSVLLSHRPERIEDYQAAGFDLVLAGHAHGGQWRIPYLLNGLLAPNQGFFPKYAGGLYQISPAVMVVGRGLARESTRIPRIFNRPEVVVIDVNPG